MIFGWKGVRGFLKFEEVGGRERRSFGRTRLKRLAIVERAMRRVLWGGFGEAFGGGLGGWVAPLGPAFWRTGKSALLGV